jgi:hypothetical protein
MVNVLNFRLGRNGVEEIMAHPWFSGIDWMQLRNIPAPFVPEVLVIVIAS